MALDVESIVHGSVGDRNFEVDPRDLDRCILRSPSRRLMRILNQLFLRRPCS